MDQRGRGIEVKNRGYHIMSNSSRSIVRVVRYNGLYIFLRRA
jgi:hypothetical protein